MYKTKKEIEKWIKLFNPEQVERLRADNYLDYIDDEDLDLSLIHISEPTRPY